MNRPSEFIDAGDRIVVRFIWQWRRLRPLRLNIEFDGASDTVRKGKIFVIEHFWDHAEALEAVGLSEQDAHADP